MTTPTVNEASVKSPSVQSKETVTTPEETVLKQMVNAPEIVSAFGRTYEIKRFTLGPMTQAAEYVGPLGYLLKRLILLPKDEHGRPRLTEDEILDFAVTAISVSGPSIMGLISVATREPLEFLEDQDPMEGLRIFAKVVEKNLDFFTQQKFDELKQAFAPLMERILKSGGAT